MNNVKTWEFGVIVIYKVDEWEKKVSKRKIVVDTVKRNIW